ncbi:hypothetical protein [Aeromonas caviae]|nr:hypothetical protein [Aeromonas caviae]
MTRTLLALELEGVTTTGADQVVLDYGLRVDGYALYLRYQDRTG